MIRYSVSSKAVGVFIYNLRSYIYKEFAIYFALWGDGGPNWHKEYSIWIAQQKSEWTVVKKKKYFAQVVHDHSSGVHRSIFWRLSFPIDYYLNYYDVALKANSS